jgi:hypothetical protein
MTKAEFVEHVAIIVQLPKHQIDAVLAGDYGRSAQGKHYRVARLWALSAPSSPSAYRRQPTHGDVLQMLAKAVPAFTVGKAFQVLV